MAVADILRDVGNVAKTTGRVAGAVLEPLGKSVANEEAGYAPEIAEEKRQHQQKLEDEQLDVKAKALESQLEMGRKYGTLDAKQQQQYIDQITNLYSNPRHAGTLMEKLRKAIHPNGAFAQGPQSPLPDAQPQGGTDAAGAAERLKEEAAQGKQEAEQKREDTQKSWEFFSKYIPDEDKPKAQAEWANKQLGITQTLKSIPGAAGQPVKGADGRYYLPKEQADGTIVQEPMPPDWKPTQRTSITPKAGISGGKLVFGVQTPTGWATVDGKPLPDFRPQPNSGLMGTWQIDEDGSTGQTRLFNTKTGEQRTVGDDLHKSGYYAKQVAPLEAAKNNITDYLNGGVFDGPGDIALQHEFFTATQPATGFRMTQVQQDLLQGSQNYLNSAKARIQHALTGTYFSDEQRQQIARAAQEAIDAKEKALQGSTGAQSVGSLLPKTGAKKVGGQSSGDPKVDQFLKSF